MPTKKRPPPESAADWDELYLSQLKTEEGRALYRAICRDLEQAGALGSATRSLARDAAAQEDVIVAAMADIRKNGAVEKLEQGAQKLRIENRSLKVKLKAEQRKEEIFGTLGLLPAKKAPGRPAKAKDEDEEKPEADDDGWNAF